MIGWLAKLFRRKHAQGSIHQNEQLKIREHLKGLALEKIDNEPTEQAKFCTLGNMAIGSKGYKTAIKCYDLSLDIDPNQSGVWLMKGIAFGELNQPYEALTCFKRALKLEPNNSMAWFCKGVVLGELGGRTEPIECYDNAIEINPKLEAAWHNKIIALNEIGRVEEAMRTCENALAHNSEFARGWLLKGIFLQDMGFKKDALMCFEQAKLLGDDLGDKAVQASKIVQMRDNIFKFLTYL